MFTGSFDLAIDEVSGPLEVHSFQGTEELSHAWHFDLVVSGALEHDMERVALGQRATVTLHLSGRSRVFHGVVARVSLEERLIVQGRASFRVRVVPRLAMLELTKRSRVFQDMSVPEIVASVLGDAGVAVRLALRRVHPRRVYCTQYEESDYEFIRRVLAEAGIYFYFYGGPAAGAAADAIGAVASVAGGALGAAAGALVPGDSIVCADAPDFYPTVAGDDPALLAASTVAAFAVSATTAAAVGGVASAVAGIASAATTRDKSPFLMTFVPHDRVANSVYETVWGFGVTNQVRSTGAMFRDYDPDRPMVRLQSVAYGTEPFAPSAADRAATALAAGVNAASAVMAAAPGNDGAPGIVGAVENAIGKAEDIASRLGALANRQVYEHHSPFLFPKWEVARDEGPLLLQQQRRRASVAHGEGGCHDFSPGHQFELQGHQISTLDGKWSVIKVTHEGNVHDPNERHYVNRFECVPATVHYPPERPPRVSVQVALTATVVGPPGEEIFTDDKGRIKVQFHWDREGTFNGYSSCWIRVMHPWAGAGWGHQFIPRVGTEVVVQFDGGDPDKPLVLGSVYNGTHPHPFGVPGDKTRSGIRTQTSPGGAGYNELSFEDGAGREEVFLKAQRDLKEEIGKDRTTRVGSNAHEEVGGEKRMIVGKNLVQVAGGDHHTFISGVHYDSVDGNRTTTIGGSYKLAVAAEMAVEVGTANKPRSQEVYAHANYIVGAGTTIQMTARQAIRLACGSSVIEIGPKEIRLTAETIALDARKELTARGNGPGLRLGDEAELTSKAIRIVSEKASVELDQNAKIDGAKIMLNCKGVAPKVLGKVSSDKTKKLKARFTDQMFKAIAGKDFIAVSGGARFEGATDGDGSIDLDVPAEAESATVTIYPDKRPVGRELKYQIRLTDVPPANTMKGVKVRLENLGYYWGQANEDFDVITRNALRDFQQDHGLEVTEYPDEATIQKLQEIAKI